MGGAKAQMDQEWAQGWSFTSQWVCSRCVEDTALQRAIHAAERPNNDCDFCGLAPAAPLDALMEAFANGIYNEYERAEGNVIWDDQEGGWQWPGVTDTWDLLEGFRDVLVGEGLFEAVRDSMEFTSWVERDFVTRRRDQVLIESWGKFCDAVRYETRYVFWLRNTPTEEAADPGEVPPARILHEVGKLIAELRLVRTLSPGDRLWRARVHTRPIAPTAAELGTAPRAAALRSNRMNPAGIPMFYGADTSDTAKREAAQVAVPFMLTWGAFELTAPATIVDFTRLPAIPSMFDPDWGHLRRALVFLHDFVDQLRSRIRPDHEEIDYVPTQIVTEFLLRVHGGGGALDGIRYPSALIGAPCVVLDVGHELCIDESEAVPDGLALRLRADSVDSFVWNPR